MASWSFVCNDETYVPAGYIMQKGDEEILARLTKSNIDPDCWLSIWSELGFSKVSDVMLLSKTELARTSLKPVPLARVCKFLDAQPGASSDIALRCQPFPPFICPEGKDHCPKSSWKRTHIKGWLYNAAWQGCLPCVQYCIEGLGVDAQVESDTMKYTVVDWAQWAVDREVKGATDVVAYLSSMSSCST